MPERCSHLDAIQVTTRPASVPGCEDCLREGTQWLHLRMCLTCGHVGCCDDSPRTHATKHNRTSDHPLITSLQPAETWSYCYPDDLGMEIAEVTGTTQIPRSPLEDGAQ